MLMRAVELRIDYLGRSLQIMKQYCFQSTTACPAKTKPGTKPEKRGKYLYKYWYWVDRGGYFYQGCFQHNIHTFNPPPRMFNNLLIGGGVRLSADNWVRKMGWLPSPAADAAVSVNHNHENRYRVKKSQSLFLSDRNHYRQLLMRKWRKCPLARPKPTRPFLDCYKLK